MGIQSKHWWKNKSNQIHDSWPKVCGHANNDTHVRLLEISFKTTDINMKLYNSLHSSGKAFHKEPGCRDLLPFVHKSISEVGHWRWAIRPRSFRPCCSSSSQRCWMRFRSGICARQQTFPYQFFMDLPLCTGALSCWKRKDPVTTHSIV